MPVFDTFNVRFFISSMSFNTLRLLRSLTLLVVLNFSTGCRAAERGDLASFGRKSLVTRNGRKPIPASFIPPWQQALLKTLELVDVLMNGTGCAYLAAATNDYHD